MEGRQPFEGEFQVILVIQGAAPVAVPMRPPENMRPGEHAEAARKVLSL